MKTTDRNQIIQNLSDFRIYWMQQVQQWEKENTRGTEKRYSESFFRELVECFGIKSSRELEFQKPANRADTDSSLKGAIDMFYPGVVLAEAKSHYIGLDEAHQQAQAYLYGGDIDPDEKPRVLLMTNFKQFRIEFIDSIEPDYEFDLNDIAENVDALMFLHRIDAPTPKRQEQASIEASKLMANLYTTMVGDSSDVEVGDDAPEFPEDEDRDTFEVSVFLSRILFLLFAEDSELIPRGSFTRFLEEHTNAESLGGQLQSLFETLNNPVEKRDRNLPDYLAVFPYVNGKLFAQHVPTRYFSAEMRDALLTATNLDWSGISPAIFGSLFQMVKSKEARRADGEHYTSEANILKVIGPLFLDDFRHEADRLIRNKSTTVKQLRSFQNDLATYQFLDPACGSGNFLVVAYRELRLIETDVIAEIYRREKQSTWSLNVEFDQKLRIDQFHGIEKNWWPALIAEVAMFLVDHQANIELSKRIGLVPERLPLKTAANIRHADALKVDWGGGEIPDAPMTFVFGNPPFLGNVYQSEDQRKQVVSAWAEVGIQKPGKCDLVTAWHAKAVSFFSNRQGAFAYVTTNSIAQGSHVPLVFGTLRRHGWVPEFAHQSFPWDAEAAVHCVVIGFTRDRGMKQRLWIYKEKGAPPVEVTVKQSLNAYLVDGPDVVVEKRTTPLSPVLPQVSFGTMAVSGNNLDPKPGTPKPEDDPIAMKYVRRLVGAQELIHDIDRWCLWLEDLDPKDLAKSPALRDRVEASRKFREESRATGDAFKLRQVPHLFRPNKSRPQTNYLCIPRTFSENRPYFTADYLPAEVIANDNVYTANDPEGFAFAVISSSMFMTWQQTVGGRLKTDTRFAKDLVWNTFPMPEVDEKTRSRIINAGQKVLEARELRLDLTLDEQYKVMSPELVKAHNTLDAEVDKAFGAEKRLSNEQERLMLLFEEYENLNS